MEEIRGVMNERMAKVETNIENIKDQINEIKILLSESLVKQDVQFNQMDKKFAPKWIEKFVIALIVGGGVTLFGVLISMIIKV